MLNYSTKPVAEPDATLALTKANLDRTQLGEATMDELVASGDVKLTGKRQAWDDFMGLLDTVPFWFPIVTP